MTQPSHEFLALQAALAGEYSLQREIGRGGMGIVYLARDVQLDRDVAIKVLPAHLASSDTSRERFLREARTAAGLSHPNIVPIHRVGEARGFVFFVMSYVDGETLGERLRGRGPLPPAEATRVLREVAWALAYAHGRGIVHRDVKPDNILLEAGSGRALVTDFGIAHGGAPAAHDTDPGKLMGTAHFMSPEQAAGEPVDGRSDLYGLGVVGYLAVSGRLPFDVPSVPALLVRQATEPAPSVMRAAPGLPRALSEAIDRCLARDPAERFPDGESMAAALAPVPEARPSLPPTLRAWLGARNPLLIPFWGWSAGFGAISLATLLARLTGHPRAGLDDILIGAAMASLPLLPVVGYHLNQARRQFRAGHTLADLRSALEIARRERAEAEALSRDDREPVFHRMLRIATGGSLAILFGVIATDTLHNSRGSAWLGLASIISTLALGAVSNAFDVQFIPTRIRAWWHAGIRDRIWRGRAGEWLARRLGAPDRSAPVGGGVFRPTEAALGVAASELFAALPKAYREQLAELPAMVEALEARAVEARAEIEVVAGLVPDGSNDADVLAARRRAAAAHLAESVAALEGIRLDLLRLHAGTSDLAPLTTLIDAARVIGEDLRRLADAQRELNDAGLRHPHGAERIQTPA